MEVLGSHVESKQARRKRTMLETYGRITDAVIVKNVEPWTAEMLEARRLELVEQSKLDALGSRYDMQIEVSGESFARTGGAIDFLPTEEGLITALRDFVGKGALKLHRGDTWQSPEAGATAGFKAATKLARTMNGKGFYVAASAKLSNANTAVIEVVRIPTLEAAPTLEADES